MSEEFLIFFFYNSGIATRVMDLKHGSINFPKQELSPQNSMSQGGEMKQICYWGSANIRRQCTKFTRPCDQAPVICVLLV